MTRELLLEAQNAYARVEYANEVYNHLIEVRKELTDNPNNTDIFGATTKNRELVIRNLSSYTPEIRDEAIRLLRKVTTIVISDGIQSAIAYVLNLLKENERYFNDIGAIREPFWISVEDALPLLLEAMPFSDPVIIRYYNRETSTEHYTVSQRFADDTLFRWRVEDEDENNIVTHWMPIPIFNP